MAARAARGLPAQVGLPPERRSDPGTFARTMMGRARSARALEASRESRARGRRREGEEGEEGEEEEGEARRRARGGQLAGRVGAAGGAARAGGRVTSWREPLGQAGRRQARARAMDRRWPSDTLAGTGDGHGRRQR
ncbi:hypothetical protein CNMCM8057_008253 [Aspergillus fumigatus]|nr:hypothetical protein CNMCM8057_008253 [Aspergillus fumigatus]